MLQREENLPLNDTTWRRINMRKVSHLIGAEMLHNLYNRHWPRINSLRFRHTITNFDNGTVESYAPIKEWEYLQRWLSKKFLSLDPILLREIEAILNPDYALIHELNAKIDATDLPAISDQDLALLLIDIMDYPLGDIYKLNVVQIEYSLNFALHDVLKKFEPGEQDRNELLSRLIAPGVLTISQQEEVAFDEIVAQGRKDKVADPFSSKKISNLIALHHKRYAGSHCAYGELPPSVEDYVTKYLFVYNLARPLLTQEIAMAEVKKQKAISEDLLVRLDDSQLSTLCLLMAKIGVFRDHNKAILGDTVLRRLLILDEISRRTRTKRSDLDYYLTAELTALLETEVKLSDDIIRDRKDNGVCFIRDESMIHGNQNIASSQPQAAHDELKGICASPGRLEGIVKIILSRKDIGKMEPGDIMVAIGTDFDLLEIMNLSSGIVTEEGGLLSHASVVSRELKKPCLIGVPMATKKLKDGYKIQLDATAGIVRILEKKA